MKLGHEVTIACRNYGYLGPMAKVEGVNVRKVPGSQWTKGQGGWGCSFRRLIEEEAEKADLVHNHGVWLAANYYARRAAVNAGRPLVNSPRGMLEGWSLGRARIKKGVAWWLFERENLRSAKLFHATSSSEAEAIATALRIRMRIKIKEEDGLQATGGVKPSVGPRSTAAGGKWPRRSGALQSDFAGPGIVVAANGVEIPAGISGREILEKRLPKLKGKKWVVFMSRIHPKKGLLELAKAWMEMRQGDAGWELVIVGPEDDTGYAEKVRAELRGEGVWTGELAGEEKWGALGKAEFVALPTYSENFGIVVAEALAAGRPVLTTTGTPWGAARVARPREDGISDMGYGKPFFAPSLASSGGATEGGFAGGSMNLEERKCGVICEPGREGVKMGLEKMLKMDDAKREEMGRQGKEWMRKDFSWESAAERLIKAYRDLAE